MKTIPTYSFHTIGKEEKTVDVFPWSEAEFYDVAIPHSHSYHEMLFFKKGKGKHRIDGYVYTLKDSSLHVVPQHYPHAVEQQGYIEGFTIAVSDVFVEQLCLFDRETDYRSFWEYPSVINFSDAEYADIEFYLQEICREDISTSYRQNICVSIILHLLSLQPKHPSQQNSFIATIQKAVQKHYTKRLSTEDYATMLNMSAASLNAKLRRNCGKTLMQLQDEKLISSIKRYITSTENSLKEIAYYHGFEDYAHFSNFFKKHSGISPMQFKEKLKKHKK